MNELKLMKLLGDGRVMERGRGNPLQNWRSDTEEPGALVSSLPCSASVIKVS